ncbi:putative XPG-I domain, PIN domain-containing protein [Lupinus albus]|uniref:Putative XPG-I domain, PIN domain-containing protein n=1 Tax=Lupinus albus TaxID=3870 RepID=A0A6A4QWY6_LUPAL|nr:putative XPG-I domain, PIN domain-containing protein [Lupinus albus]
MFVISKEFFFRGLVECYYNRVVTYRRLLNNILFMLKLCCSYSEGFTEAIKADNEEDIEQFNKRTVKAPSEAEAQCAALCKAGKASSYLLRACKQGASYKLK